MTPAMQVKLLRALENREVIPVGADRSISVDIRVVTATNVDLLAAIKKGENFARIYFIVSISFKLKYLPCVNALTIFHLLAEHMLRGLSEGEVPLSIDPQAMEYLEAWPWNGNVRELSNVMRRASVLADNRITVGDLPRRIIEESPLVRNDESRDKTSVVISKEGLVLEHDAQVEGEDTPPLGLPAIHSKTNDPARTTTFGKDTDHVFGGLRNEGNRSSLTGTWW